MTRSRKVFSSAIEYREELNHYHGFVKIQKADCDYCGKERSESAYREGTCSHCGGPLRGYIAVNYFFMEPVELIYDPRPE